MTAKLALGTAQLGLHYGIANQEGALSEAAAISLLHAARDAGITLIDTARGYGEAESRIGKAQLTDVTIATKLAPACEERADAQDSVRISLEQLGQNRLDSLLLHRFAHYHISGLWAWLCEQQQEGVIGTLGISVQTPEEAKAAIQIPEVGFIQLPCNLLDGRWHAVDFSSRPDIHIQVRSALLQGLLVQDDAALWPEWCGEAEMILQRLTKLQEQCQRRNKADLCYAYLRGLPWVDSIVVGMETEAQLRENLALFEQEPLSEPAIQRIQEQQNAIPERLLNPALW